MFSEVLGQFCRLGISKGLLLELTLLTIKAMIKIPSGTEYLSDKRIKRVLKPLHHFQPWPHKISIDIQLAAMDIFWTKISINLKIASCT